MQQWPGASKAKSRQKLMFCQFLAVDGNGCAFISMDEATSAASATSGGRSRYPKNGKVSHDISNHKENNIS